MDADKLNSKRPLAAFDLFGLGQIFFKIPLYGPLITFSYTRFGYSVDDGNELW
jgi:hypothetical protein